MKNFNIIQDFIPLGRRNRPGRVNPMRYITIHETGNTRPGADALAHANFVKNPATQVSWHYTTDCVRTVQHLPENEDAFHAGDGAGKGNRQSIGIEIAVNSDGNFLRTIERTAELVADICKRRNIPIENIRQHFNWSRKNCPENIRAGRPITWDAFIDMVRKHLEPPQETMRFDIFGEMVEIDAFIRNDRTFVSARQLLETMGYDIKWNDSTRTVVVKHKT